jgi:hypothetical protein
VYQLRNLCKTPVQPYFPGVFEDFYPTEACTQKYRTTRFPLFSRRCTGLELMHTFLVPLAPALLRTPPRCAAQKCTQGVIGGSICARHGGRFSAGLRRTGTPFFRPPSCAETVRRTVRPFSGTDHISRQPAAALHLCSVSPLQRQAGWPLKAQSKPSADKLRTPPSPASFDKRSGAPGPASADPGPQAHRISGFRLGFGLW